MGRPLRRPVQRQADGRLAGLVVDGGERAEGADGRAILVQGVIQRHHAQRLGNLRQGRRQHHVVGLVEPRHLDRGGHEEVVGLGQLGGGHGAADLHHGPGRRLHVVLGEGAAERGGAGVHRQGRMDHDDPAHGRAQRVAVERRLRLLHRVAEAFAEPGGGLDGGDALGIDGRAG